MINSSLGAKEYLRRTKSTRSIRRDRPLSSSTEIFDQDIARQHATAAASVAMRRSTERSSTDSQRSYDRLGGPGSMAVPRRRHRADSYIQSSYEDSLSSSSHRRSNTSDDNSYDDDQMSAAALPPISEFGSLDGRDSSLPSSYRRLRKTRSMFSTRLRLPRSSYGKITEPFAHSAQSTETPRSYRTLRRSMSFLKGENRSPITPHFTQRNDAAIQMARSQFLKSHAQEHSHNEHSPLIRSKREHRPFTKTFRNSSNSGGHAVSTPSPVDHSKNTLAYGRTRSLSSSIKRGIKRVLGISKPPVEHLPVEELYLSPTKHHTDSSSIRSTTESSRLTENMRPYISSRQSHIASPGQPVTLRTVRSSESLATTESRVTSWADSTVANTITASRLGDRSHLSIIEENAGSNQNIQPLTPSASPRKEAPASSSVRPGGSVDSQRLYTALMRRIGRESPHSSAEDIVFGQVKEHRAIPTRASSVHPRCSRQTVRHIPSEESITSPRSFATAQGGTVTPQRQSYRQTENHTSQGPQHLQVGGAEYLYNSSPVVGVDGSVFEGTSDKEDDSKTVVRTASQPSLEDDTDSPSVYSRTTSGNSPTTKGPTRDSSSSGPDDEPGVATIFASQRSNYSSPTRRSGSLKTESPRRPSVDWQHWMESQMERIESLTPRRDHYREDAQIYGEVDFSRRVYSREARDHDGILTNRKRDNSAGSPLTADLFTTCKSTAARNFSRPFSRSSSTRTIVPMEKKSEGSTPSSVSSIPVLQRPQGSPDKIILSVGRGGRRDNNHASPSMQRRTSNRFAYPESPTPKRVIREPQQITSIRGRHGRSQARWSSTVVDGRVLRSRSTHVSHNNSRLTNENLKAEDEQEEVKEPYPELQSTYSPVSSKRMVEMFLSSRRQQMRTEMSSDSSTTEEAFI